jgi:hypothetical protein
MFERLTAKFEVKDVLITVTSDTIIYKPPPGHLYSEWNINVSGGGTLGGGRKMSE